MVEVVYKATGGHCKVADTHTRTVRYEYVVFLCIEAIKKKLFFLCPSEKEQSILLISNTYNVKNIQDD